MSSDSDIVVQLEKRSVLGKGLQHLRAHGKLPAVIHDHGQPSSHVMGDYVVLNKMYAKAGKHHPVQLQVGKDQHLALVKDVDYEPVKHQMRHLVFQAIKQDEEVEAEVPIVFKEVEIPAEKLSLMVLRQLDHVEVKALPKDLPDELFVDPSSLVEVGDHITVADLQVPTSVTVLTDPENPIATVEMPKDQLAEAEAAAAALAEDAAAHAEPTEEEPTEAEQPEEAEPTEEEAPPEESKDAQEK